MKKPALIIIASSLLCGAAIPAMAQGAGGAEECVRLQRLTDENRERFNEEWVTAADRVLEGGNREECATYAAQAERGVKQLEAQANDAAGNQQAGTQQQQAQDDRIIVTQPEPRVTVQQPAPQIAVTQPQPEVTVNQPQPQIVVRQAQPTIRVEMPQPVITIDQPQPEIIVRMPEPQVQVSQQQPQVRLSQEQPQVQVEQAQPQVRIQADDNEQAEVDVQKTGQPVVRVQEADGQAQVNVRRAEPQVSYEAAEPKVEVQQSGEPKIQYSQSGEPKVTFQRMDGQQANAGVSQERTASTSSRMTDEERRRIGTFDQNERVGNASAVRVSNLIDRPVVNRQGEELGNVESIVRRNDREYVVFSHGGLWGWGESEVGIPLERVSMNADDTLVVRGLTEEELDDVPNFRMANSTVVPATESVNLTTIQ